MSVSEFIALMPQLEHQVTGKRVGRPPFGYPIEDGFLQQVPAEYVHVPNFIREVHKGREKHATAAFFDIPDATIRSILNRAKSVS